MSTRRGARPPRADEPAGEQSAQDAGGAVREEQLRPRPGNSCGPLSTGAPTARVVGYSLADAPFARSAQHPQFRGPLFRRACGDPFAGKADGGTVARAGDGQVGKDVSGLLWYLPS